MFASSLWETVGPNPPRHPTPHPSFVYSFPKQNQATARKIIECFRPIPAILRDIVLKQSPRHLLVSAVDTCMAAAAPPLPAKRFSLVGAQRCSIGACRGRLARDPCVKQTYCRGHLFLENQIIVCRQGRATRASALQGKFMRLRLQTPWLPLLTSCCTGSAVHAPGSELIPEGMSDSRGAKSCASIQSLMEVGMPRRQGNFRLVYRAAGKAK